MHIPAIAKSFERKAVSTAETPFITHPWFPPSQIIPVMLLAMLLRHLNIASVSPPSRYTSAEAIPLPAAIAHPQNADSLPEYSFIYVQTR